MKGTFAFCAALILIASQVEASPSLKEKASALETKFNRWIDMKTREFKNDIETAEHKVMYDVERLIENGKRELEKMVHKVEEDLKSIRNQLNGHCYDTAMNQLIMAQDASTSDFLHCTNLTNAFVDIRDLTVNAITVTTDIMKYFKDALTNLDKCMPINTLKNLQCANEYVWSVINNISKAVPEVNEFIVSAAKLQKDAALQFAKCLHPTHRSLKTQLDTILATAHSCSQ